MYLKIIIISCALVTFTYAYNKHTGGHSNTYRKQDDHGNYKFGYEIIDGWGAKNSRHEEGDGWGNKKGLYTIKDIDGRERFVLYFADKKGFRAEIKTNEPGTGSVDSGDAIFNGPDPHGGSHTHVPSGWNNYEKNYHPSDFQTTNNENTYENDKIHYVQHKDDKDSWKESNDQK